jgi:mannosyl-glycoprotein endo-beta-N-acetylglucosaminidase
VARSNILKRKFFYTIILSFIVTLFLNTDNNKQNNVLLAESISYFKVTSETTDVYHNINGKLTKVGELLKGEIYQSVDSRSNWYLIEFGEKLGYVKMSDTQKVSGVTPKNPKRNVPSNARTITTLQDVEVFDTSSGNYKPFAKLAGGTTYQIVVEQSSWWGVNVGGRFGFIYKTSANKEFLKSDKYFKVKSSSTGVYYNNGGRFEKVGELIKDQEFIREDEQKYYHLIKYGDRLGYVRKSDTEPSSGKSIKNPERSSNSDRKIEIKHSVEVYDTSSGKYLPFAKVEEGTSYKIIVEQSTWYGINIGGRFGFVHKTAGIKEFLPSDKIFKVTSEVAEVYHNINGRLTKVGELNKGQEYYRYDEQKDYHLIQFGDRAGYVKKSDTEPSQGSSIKNKLDRKVKSDLIMVLEDAVIYDNSTRQYVQFAKISKNTYFNVVAEQKNWWAINIGNRLGFISKSVADNKLIKSSYYNLDFNRMLDIQMTATPKADGAGKVPATREQVAYYLNPSNFKEGTDSFFQFLLLDKPTNINGTQLNKFLINKGSLTNQGDAFAQAAQKYGINEVYLVSHTLHETGAGTSYESQLSKGVSTWTKLKPNSCTPVLDKNGKPVIMKIPYKVYNFYGISAYDDCPLDAGAQYAYENGWDTPAKAIIGGANFIKDGYINRGQNTLYKMRWDPAYAEENNRYGKQYATHIMWADIQAKNIAKMYSQIDGYFLSFDVPTYKNQPNAGTVPSPSTPPSETVPNIQINNVVGKTLVGLNLRNDPSTANAPITTLSQGTYLEILESNENGWLKVKVKESNLEGWVYKGVDASDGPYVEFLNLLEVNVDSGTLNVRHSFSTNSDIVGTLNKGDLVAAVLNDSNNIVTYSNGGYTWYKIYYKDRTAWVAEYVKILK